MSDEAAPEAPEAPADAGDLSQAPPEVDPYFVRDGKAVTGTGEPVEVKADEPETKEEPKPAVKTEKTPEKKKTAGETWKEIRNAQKAATAQQQQAQELLAQAQQEREAAASERELMRTNFRGWLKQNNLSLKDIIEADLQEQDVDPTQKKISEIEAYAKGLEQKLESLLKKDELASEQAATQQDIDALKTHAGTVAEDFPLVAARIEKLAPRMRAAYYAHKQATGQKPSMEMLFNHFEQELVDLGVTAPQPSLSSVATKKPLPPARGKGAVRTASRASEDQDDGDGADSDGPASLTNRQSAVRASNGRKLTREEHLAQAAAHLQFRSS